MDHTYTLKYRLTLEWYDKMESILAKISKSLYHRQKKVTQLVQVALFLDFPVYDYSVSRYDYRIKYFNLKGIRSQNAVALQDVQRLWIPFLVFDNTEKNEATKVSYLGLCLCL